MRWAYILDDPAEARQLAVALAQRGWKPETQRAMPAGSSGGHWVVSSTPRTVVEQLVAELDLRDLRVLSVGETCDRCSRPATRRVVITPSAFASTGADLRAATVVYLCDGCRP